MITDFHRLIKSVLSLESNDITEVKATYHDPDNYFFDLRRGALDKFSTLINFNHPSKITLLNAIIKRGTSPRNKYPKGVARDKILNMLFKKPSTSIELSLKLGMKSKSIRWHLEKLKKMSEITVLHTSNYGAKVWKIKNDENT